MSTPSIPHNSYTSIGAAGSETESDSSSGWLFWSSPHSSLSWSTDSASSVSHVSPSIATLAALYSFPPLPPPAPIIEQVDSSDSESPFDQYQSGVMMAARRIKAALCPEPPKRSSFNTNAPPPTHEPIPGWTDGSDAWRSSVYSLSSPANAPQYPGDDKNTKAYRSTVASPHRSRGVNSTVGESVPSSYHSASTASLPTTKPALPRSTSYADDLYSKYPLSSSRRSESRTSLVMSTSPTSLPASCAASARSSSRRRHEKSLLKPGAEGKLLVPDVKMKTSSLSQSNDSSYDAASLSSWRSGSSYPASSRRSVRSPLSRYGSQISEGSMLGHSPESTMASLPTLKRPTVESEYSLPCSHLHC